MSTMPDKRYGWVSGVILLLAVLPGAGVAWLHVQLEYLHQQQLQLVQQRQQLQLRLTRFQQHRQIARVYARWYPWLESTLMLPRPDADLWDSRLFTIQQQSSLADVHYSLTSVQVCPAIRWPVQACTTRDPQHQSAAPFLSMTGMQLTLSQPHEAALLDWLAALQQAYPAAFLIKKCEWSLMEDGAEIKASCWLDWFHLVHMLPEGAARK